MTFMFILMILLWIGGTTTASFDPELCLNQRDVPFHECQGLIDLYNHTMGNERTTRTGWGSSLSICGRYGVVCSSGHITALFLGNNNLQGTIPLSLVSLTGLQTLYIQANRLASLPESLIRSSIQTGNLRVESNCLRGVSPLLSGFLTQRTTSALRIETQNGSQCALPIPIISHTPATLTNQSVQTHISFHTGNIPNQSCTRTTNGTCLFTWQWSGDVIGFSLPIWRIDTLPPSIVSPNEGNHTQPQQFLFSDRFLSGAVLRSLDTGMIQRVKNADIFSGEGNFELIVEDYAGNKTTRLFGIDTSKPLLSGVTNQETYTRPPTIFGTDRNLQAVGFSGISTPFVQTGAQILPFQGPDGLYVAFARDSFGNQTTATIIIHQGSGQFLSIASGATYTGGVRLTSTVSGTLFTVTGPSFTGVVIPQGSLISGDGNYRITVDFPQGIRFFIPFTIDTVPPHLLGDDLVVVKNFVATYGLRSNKTGVLTFGGKCGVWSGSYLSSGIFLSKTLTNGDYSDCTVTVTDPWGLASTLPIPRFVVKDEALSTVTGEIPIMCTLGIYSGGRCVLPPPVIYHFAPPDPDIVTVQFNPRRGDISRSPYSPETNAAYLWAYEYGITTMPDIITADMQGNILRMHLAKMLVEYAINILKITQERIQGCSFTDIGDVTQEMQYYIIKACSLGLMGLDSNGKPSRRFNPRGTITRGQFGTALSRLLRGEQYNITEGQRQPFYTNHLRALQEAGIMTMINDPRPAQREKRGFVMIMLQRTAQTVLKL
ncbi:MAG: S-layer homology domain-containing protein [Candidatus Absconditabacterales bacterium]|nr:S-layer homology domain-containing protein [Candidatus Absconditabacterales bacterium]